MSALRRLRLDNGLRVILERVPETRSVSVVIAIGRGSRHERPEQGGISHFIEHLLFKGTETRDVYQIADEMNMQGGHMNASTGVETIRLYTRVITADLPAALELFQDLTFRSTFPAPEIERERGVILEEIGETSDQPEEVCYENLMRVLWGGHSLSRPILGTRETVSRFTRAELLDYWRSACSPENMVLSLAGGFEEEAALELVHQFFDPAPPAPSITQPDEPAIPGGGVLSEERDLEQVQFNLALPGLSRSDPRRFGLFLLDTILGGGPGSRLYNEIRERRGLAYTIGSSLLLSQFEGAFMVYGSTSPEQWDEVHAICLQQLADVATKGPAPRELELARHQLERSHLLALESTSVRAARNADTELYGEPHLSTDEVLERLRAVTVDELRELASHLFSNRKPAISLVGPLGNESREGEEEELVEQA